MILGLRKLAERFLFSVVGNGSSTSFWFDVWTPQGPLLSFLGESGPRSLCIPLSAKVADACSGVGWKLPPPRSDQALALHTHLTTISLPSASPVEDSFQWVVDGHVCQGFSSSRTWEALRPRQDKKRWTKSVWFKGAIPKHAFNMWVSHLNRLPTRQRLVAWGICASADCCLCASHIESRDHLLISCSFSTVIWRLIFNRLCPALPISTTWAELLSWTRCASTSAPSLLRKVAAQASVFHIWKQRNNAYHNSQFIPPVTIFKLIDRDVRNIITARRKRKRWRKLMLLWIQ